MEEATGHCIVFRLPKAICHQGDRKKVLEKDNRLEWTGREGGWSMAEGPDRADAVDAERRGRLWWKDQTAKLSVVE